MKNKPIAGMASIAIFLTVAPAALAAEYYIKIADIEGETSKAIDIQSWSWSTSKADPAPTAPEVISPRDAASGLPTGKRTHRLMADAAPSPVDGRTTRDAASGLPTGKRMHKPVSMASTGGNDENASTDSASASAPISGQSDLAAAKYQAEIKGFSLTLPADPAASAGLCPAGKHIAKATIVARSDGSEIPLKNITVQSCSAVAQSTETPDGASAAYSKIALTGSMVDVGTGHVTVLK